MSKYWQGRNDGPGIEHLRWHHVVREVAQIPESDLNTGGGSDGHGTAGTVDAVILGFASEAGVRRNQGRVGAAEGPGAIRKALASMALTRQLDILDIGDVTVTGDALETGQRELADRARDVLNSGHRLAIFGGGHEIAYPSFLGLFESDINSVPETGNNEKTSDVTGLPRIGILNLDAHFDLRRAEQPTSGTPFLQISELLQANEQDFHYAVVGISQPGNTNTLFDTADRLGVQYLFDDQCTPDQIDSVVEFVQSFLDRVDVLYLTIDLDVLPASVAPGVSAPAVPGVDFNVIQRVCDEVAASGKLRLFDIAELNPSFDIDAHTAKAAARLAHRILLGWA